MIPLRDNVPSVRRPWAVYLLVAANLGAFAFTLPLDPRQTEILFHLLGVVPARFSDPAWAAASGYPGWSFLSFFTSMFLHGGWMHLIGNMWFLWIYGDNVEDILGHGKFLLFYLLAGVAAALVHVLLNPMSRVPTIGASGAIAGVMGAYLIKFPHSRILTLVPIFVFFTTIEVPAVLILAYWFVIQFFSGIGSVGYSHLSQGGVAWWAHVGGFVAGMALILLLGTNERYRRRRDLHW